MNLDYILHQIVGRRGQRSGVPESPAITRRTNLSTSPTHKVCCDFCPEFLHFWEEPGENCVGMNVLFFIVVSKIDGGFGMREELLQHGAPSMKLPLARASHLPKRLTSLN